MGEEARTEALLAFDGPPRGIASWLAAPAPMGALDFISPTAQCLGFGCEAPSQGDVGWANIEPGFELREVE